MELDQFMKEFAVDFLKEIIELFFPKLAPKLYFSQKKDLNKELYTESPKGEERFVDVLLEIGYKAPSPFVLLVHVESQQSMFSSQFRFSDENKRGNDSIFQRECWHTNA